MPSEKLRRLGKVGAMVGFGLFIFAIVFYVSLPYTRFKDLMAEPGGERSATTWRPSTRAHRSGLG